MLISEQSLQLEQWTTLIGHQLGLSHVNILCQGEIHVTEWGGGARKTELLLSDKRGMNSGLAKLMTPIP